jgi:hypothetical protein
VLGYSVLARPLSSDPGRSPRGKDGAPLHAFVQSSQGRVMVAQLRALGISVELNQERYQNGRFARLNDPEGSPIQLGDQWDSSAPTFMLRQLDITLPHAPAPQ